jgi:hypothetical protein
MPARPGATPIRRLLPGDVEVAQILRDSQVVAQRFANGNFCPGAVRDGRLGGYLWLSTSPYEEDEVQARYELGPAQGGLGLHIPAAQRGAAAAVREALGRRI